MENKNTLVQTAKSDTKRNKLESTLQKLNDKINKMTEDIIASTTSRLINEEVNRRVDEKLRKIRKAIDDSI